MHELLGIYLTQTLITSHTGCEVTSPARFLGETKQL